MQAKLQTEMIISYEITEHREVKCKFKVLLKQQLINIS